MDFLQLLRQRRSTPSRLLAPPGPDAEQLRLLLEAAMQVPDHGRLAPWRFVVVRGEARTSLGERLAHRLLELDPQAGEDRLLKERQRFLQAPVVVAVVACPLSDHKVPVIEQLLSGGAVCFALLQAAHALGFGGQWLTGWAAHDRDILDHLGLSASEQLLGFIHLGSPAAKAVEPPRPTLDGRLTEWIPPSIRTPSA